MQLSNWATVATCLTALIGYKLSSEPQTEYKTLRAVHHTFYTVTMVANPVVICVFWTILWREVFFDYIPTWSDGNERFYYQLMIVVFLNHTAPAVSAYVLMRISDTILVMNRLVFIGGMGLLYLAFNWYSLKFSGQPPSYSFLTYDTVESWATIGIIYVGTLGFYYNLVRYDQSLKTRNK